MEGGARGQCSVSSEAFWTDGAKVNVFFFKKKKKLGRFFFLQRVINGGFGLIRPFPHGASLDNVDGTEGPV